MKYLKIFFFPVLIILSFSCKEDFSPYAGHDQKYVLNCILRGDSTFQYAAVTSSFGSSENFSSNVSDRFLKNADIRIWDDNEVYKFRDTVITTKIYGKETAINIYKTTGFVPKPNRKFEIVALLPDGKRLKSWTNLPKQVNFEFSSSDSSIPSKNNQFVFVRWESAGEDLIYAPEINIYYKKAGFPLGFAKKVPISYIKQDGKYYPNFATPSKERFVSIKMDAIRRAMNEISGSDPNKSNYTILTMIVHVHTYDKNLSEYYVSSAQSLDQFSINVDALDFSNIEGGLGIFGSYNSKKYVIKFNREFIGSFGYKVGVEE